jgi:DNA helicase-2/ATP-dependent DNA helicase PcrA
MMEYVATASDPLVELSLQNFSYSRIKTYEECKLRYFYQYIIKIPQDYGYYALLGNVVHKALEDSTNENTLAKPKELQANYRSALSELDPNYTIPSDLREAGTEMLASFVDDLPPEEKAKDYEPKIGTEVFPELKFTTLVGRGRFNGLMDLVKVTGNRVEITDYKSGKQEVSHANVSTDLQLGVYSLVANEIFPDREVYAQLYYLRSRRKKGHLFTKDDLSTVRKVLTTKVDTILRTQDFPPTDNARSCYWCSYAKDGTCDVGAKRLRKSR